MRHAFKMFNKDLTCTYGRGRYQYAEDVWFEEPEANCVRNGFHCAENPLDCLSYYPDWDKSVCYMVEIDGDIDEDSTDSKISCTRIRLIKKLDAARFVSHACWYMLQHPEMPDNHLVQHEQGMAKRYPFVIVRGKEPIASGRIGDVIGIIREKPDSREAETAGVYLIDGKKYLPTVFYDVCGKEVRGWARLGGAGCEERNA